MLFKGFNIKKLLFALLALYLAVFVLNWGYLQINEALYGYDKDHWLTARNPDGYDKYKKLVYACGETVDQGAFFWLKRTGLLSEQKLKSQLQMLNEDIEQSDFRIRNYSCEKSSCSVGLVQYGAEKTLSIERLNTWLGEYQEVSSLHRVDTYVNYLDWNEGEVICAENAV